MMAAKTVQHEVVLRFWFAEVEPEQWWKADRRFDSLIRERFAGIHEKALRCELAHWRESARGRLAEIIVLDQFSRNIHRGQAQAFLADPLALALAQEAVSAGADKLLEAIECSFLYMPFMHSESIQIHRRAVELFTRLNIASALDFERRHQAIIERFGRYPHRNAILGRVSTKAELSFLGEPGSSF